MAEFVAGIKLVMLCRHTASLTAGAGGVPRTAYLTDEGPVVVQGTPLVTGAADVPRFDREALITALRIDQAGKGTFPEFLDASWRAGVIHYEVDLTARTVIYYGCLGETYVEQYPGWEM